MNFGISKDMLKLANKDWTARWGRFQASESTAEGVVKQSSLLSHSEKTSQTPRKNKYEREIF